MEDQRRERVTPRRLSFNLDDFSGTPDAERNQGSNKTHEVQPELNLLQNLETPANADGTGVEDTPIVVTASMLNNILAGQQSLVEMVADLSSLVSSKRSNEEAVRMRNTREAADDALVTQRDLKQLLQNKLSPPNTIFDLEPPLSEAVMMIPYPQGYQPPTFPKFDGTGSAREHIMSFLDDLGVYRSSKSLRLKEFSKSLAGRAFTWYAKLKPHSIETWESLVTEFCGKFLEEEGAIHIIDLGRIKQKAGEGLITFIKRYRDRELQCKETLPEADLVYGCIKNIEDGSQIFLSLSGVTTFAELMKKAADIAEAMKKQGKKVKGTEDMFDLVEEWLKDGTLRVRTTKGPLTREQYDSPEYCILHKANNHNTTDCWTIRKVFHKQVKLGKVLLPEAEQGEELHKRPLPNHSVNTITPSSSTIRVEEIEEERYDEEKVVATELAKTRGFRMLFGQLEAIIEGIKIRRALVDNGSGVNIIPTYLFHKLNMPSGRIRKSDITLSTFHGEAVESLGRVHAVLEVGPIRTVNVFHVVEGDSSYQLLLGRPWIHLHQCVQSTLHQCIKSNFRGKEIEIPGVKAPFEATESHLIDAALFDDVAPPGSSQLRTEQGILLREVNGFGSTSNTSRPCQALKKPRPKERTEIKKEYLPNGEVVAATHTMSPPVASVPLRLYLAATQNAINGLMAQEVGGIERPVAYLSRVFKDAEGRYTMQEKLCLGVIYAAKKYRHYFQGHTVHIISKSEGIKLMLNNNSITGRVSKWALLLSEYDLQIIHPQRLGCQALADMMSLCPGQHEESVSQEIRGDMPEVNTCQEKEKEWWDLKFDGTPSQTAGGAGVVISKKGTDVFSFSYQLNFPCTNNEAECEALILGLKMALDMKEASLAVYRDEASRLMDLLEEVHMTRIPRAANKNADALATIGRKEGRKTSEGIVSFRKIGNPSLSIVPYVEEPSDWREPILSQFKQKIFGKTTKDYYELNWQLYRKSTYGLLMKCVTENEGGKKLECLHFAMCGQDGPSLYRRMQRVGMFWPSMKMHCEEIQRACPNCREGRESFQVNAIEGDWRHELKEYLSYGVAPESPLDAEKLKKKAERYFIEEGELFKEGLSGDTLRCLGKEEQQKIMAEVHGGVCGRHQGGRSLWAEILKNGYYWPTMREDTLEFARRCRACQLHGNLIHAPAASMRERGDVAVLIEGLRDRESEEMLQHHRRLTLTYEKMVRPRMFQEGELVLKAIDAVMRKQHVSKWAPNWEGPYIVQEAKESGYCTLIVPEDQSVIGPINFKYVRKYYV
ncbi:Ribonuclease H-like superfamily [Sesbania bispinosa]|nr:Ribonuclease H-like superfamily [Sesbania bispinosa]